MIKVVVSEAYDGFYIYLLKECEPISCYWFSQDDDKTNMVELFKALGFEPEYEENY